MAREKPGFEEASKAAYPMLFAAAVVLAGSRADAEDAVQETLLRACAAYDKFRGDSSPATWMYAILTRTVAKMHKKPARQPDDIDCVELASVSPGPDARAEADDERRRVLSALRSLPPRQREIATLFYLEEIPKKAVADALCVTEDAVKIALRRARSALRDALGISQARKEGAR